MPSDDELRRVAEDVRALARSLGRDIRAAFDTILNSPPPGAQPASRMSAQEDLREAARAARQQLRQARQALRRSAGHHPGYRHPYWYSHPGEAGGEADQLTGWDNWGGRRYRPGAGTPLWETPPWEESGRFFPTALERRGGRWATAPAAVAARPAKPAPAPLRHRHDGTTVLGLLAVVFGLAWLAAGTQVANVSAQAVVAVALMVLGVAMVVTARTDWALAGRKWPVLGGGALCLALLVISAGSTLPAEFRHVPFGGRVVAATTWAQVPAVVHGGVGRTVVDLSGVQGPLPAPRTLSVDHAAGQVRIVVPLKVKVVLEASVVAGQISVNGARLAGLHRSVDETLDPSATGPALTLLVQSGFGSVIVDQSSVSPLGGGSVSTVPAAPATPPTPAAPTTLAVAGP